MSRSDHFSKVTLSLLLVLMISFSSFNSLSLWIPTKADPGSSNQVERNVVVSQEPLYTDQALTAYIALDPNNITSLGIEESGNVESEADGLLMTMNFNSFIEYAVFQLNGTIVSDSLILKGFVDGGDIDTLFEVYGWADPYTKPTIDDINETYIDETFTLLGVNDVLNGDILIEFSNISLEYILLVGRSSFTGPGYFQSLDAIEVHGFTSALADWGKDGVPDIWQSGDINTTQISTEIDRFGVTYEIMSLVGIAEEGSSNHDFLLPYIQLGIISPEEIFEDHFYIMCQVELEMPFIDAYEYLLFLDSFDLVNMTFIEGNSTVFDALLTEFDRYLGQDQRVRTYHLVDYTVNGNYDPMHYTETSGQIDGSYNTLDTENMDTDVSKEEFDLDVSIVLDIVENVLDAVKAGANIAEQFKAKIIGFIQGKIMDGVGKALLAKITKKAIKSAIKAIFSITTVKDLIVKGAKILEKLGLTLPSWLKKILDFVESIPFIDPPVEIWKVRLSFINESTGLPVLGWDFNNNLSIYTHPQGIYFGDTYSAQVILSSRDIFPVLGRIQSVNASRVVTGYLYVEDIGLGEATFAKSSLEPGEHAQGRMYTDAPDYSVVVSQAHLIVTTMPGDTLELGFSSDYHFSVEDENATALTDLSKTRAAVNNLPDPMIDLPVELEPDDTFTVSFDTSILDLTDDFRMVAIIYKPDNMFHDYWNHTFVLEDTTTPTIENVSAELNDAGTHIVVIAEISDFDLDSDSIDIEMLDDSDVRVSLTAMTFNGTLYSGSMSVADIRESASRFNYRIRASDHSGNNASTTVRHFDLPPVADILPIVVVGAVGGIAAIGVIWLLLRKK